MAVRLTWEDLGEHIDSGDLPEWLAEERAKDKARQLSEQTDDFCSYGDKRDD